MDQGTPVRTVGVLAFALSILVGCGNGGTGGVGSLSLQVTDAPVDSAQQVVVQFRAIELQGANGTTTLYYCRDATTGQTVLSTTACAQAAPQQLDLLALRNGATTLLLNNYALPSGHYQWIRLLVDATPGANDSYITISGAKFGLVIPSGAETGLKLNRGFDVAAGGQTSFTIDFDLRKSVHLPSSGSATDYQLRPTLRIVDNTTAGSIAGTVTLNSGTCTSPGVYVYTGQNVMPQDIRGTANDPVTAAPVTLNNLLGQYEYRAPFLAAGSYTIAVTCAMAQDDPDTSDAIGFTGTSNVTVSAGTTTPHNF